MNTALPLAFLAAFVLPIAYQRIRFAVNLSHFHKISLRRKTGLQIHHGHWGILWIFAATLWMVFLGVNVWAAALAGFGWGLLADEIIPSLRMPSKDRDLELRVYRDSAGATITLAVVIIVLIGAAAFVGKI